ncbi:hypothetical protein BB560_002373 [Smittium megazygosporum]|uniref:Uncharacterized protein n=1 Tax=Smittium megazygosporum TaxID=133381 RepID=A0A2T9ZEY5_9FUNG|nr:hypothetical protein BB560_002373 [Smittium megazygosporum]
MLQRIKFQSILQGSLPRIACMTKQKNICSNSIQAFHVSAYSSKNRNVVQNAIMNADRVENISKAIQATYYIPGKYKHLLDTNPRKRHGKYLNRDKFTLHKVKSRKLSKSLLSTNKTLDNQTNDSLSYDEIQYNEGTGQFEVVEEHSTKQLDLNNETEDTDSRILPDEAESVSDLSKNREERSLELFERRILDNLQQIVSVENLPSKYLSSLYWTIHGVELFWNRKKAKVYYSVSNEVPEDQVEAINYVVEESSVFFSSVLSNYLRQKNTIKLNFVQISPPN